MLEDSVHMEGRRRVCRKCVGRAHQARDGGGAKPRTLKVQHQKEPETKTLARNEAARNAQKGKAKCTGCGSTMGAFDDAVKMGADVYHRRCLRCCECGGDLSGGYAKSKNGPKCAECVGGASGNTCAGCGSAIMAGEAAAVAAGSKYHQKCLKCAKCAKMLEGGFVLDGKRLLHPECV